VLLEEVDFWSYVDNKEVATHTDAALLVEHNKKQAKFGTSNRFGFQICNWTKQGWRQNGRN